MIKLTQQRLLNLERPMIEGLPAHLSAGSGLTCDGDSLRVVADDGLDVGVFRGDEPGRLERLFENRPDLPVNEKERKKQKPDLESATVVNGHWMALGSGSTDKRMKGILDKTEFDIQPLYSHLATLFPELNIEGVAPLTDEGVLRLAQRGNGSAGENALVDLDLERALQTAKAGGSWGPELIRGITPLRLASLPGSAGPVPLTLTDLTPLDGSRCLFTAAAEDTQNTYDDGAILGSAVGVLERDGTVSSWDTVDQRVKLEGICVGPGGQILVVTDGDDPHNPATVFQAEL